MLLFASLPTVSAYDHFKHSPYEAVLPSWVIVSDEVCHQGLETFTPLFILFILHLVTYAANSTAYVPGGLPGDSVGS